MIRLEKEINSFNRDDLAFLCIIGFRKFVAYFDPFLPMNIIMRKAYNTIMVEGLEKTGKNLVFVVRDVYVFVGSFTYITDFVVLEDIGEFIQINKAEVVMGKPFRKITKLEYDCAKGLISFNRIFDNYTFQMPRTIPSIPRNLKIHTKGFCPPSFHFLSFIRELYKRTDGRDSRALKRKVKSSEYKAAKKKKLDEEVEEVEELRKHLQIVPNDDDDDVYTKATPLALKIITFTTTQLILLVEKRYPLTRLTLDQMLNNVILKVEEENEKAWGTRLKFSTAFHPQTDGQTERTIQILEDMLRSCALEKCRAPIYWDQVEERVIEGPKMIEATNEKVSVAKEKLKEARTRQKSYADKHRRSIEFQPGDRVFLKVSPARGVRRFGIKGKLSPRFIGPFEILDRVGEISYRLALPPQLSHVHNVFHVSLLRGNPSSNPNPSTNPNPKGRNRRRSKQRIEEFNLDEISPPIVTMADQRTMAQLLQAPTEGYEDAIVVPAITTDNFELKHGLLTLVQNKQLFGHDKEDPHDPV
nr:putative nucleotidyltransferase, ribonuclease H [Tanacetum cinerariifolium]